MKEIQKETHYVDNDQRQITVLDVFTVHEDETMNPKEKVFVGHSALQTPVGPKPFQFKLPAQGLYSAYEVFDKIEEAVGKDLAEKFNKQIQEKIAEEKASSIVTPDRDIIVP